MCRLSRITTLFVAVVCVVCVGCTNGLHVKFGGATAAFQETRTSVVEHVVDSAIDVESVNGAITVTESDRADVQVIAHIKAQTEERLRATSVIVARDELNNLNVRVEWPDERKGNEGCSFQMEVPNAYNVTLRSSNGKITLTGLEGTARLKTNNGAVRVNGFDGDVEVDTSNGSVKVHDVEGIVDADTSNGSIEIINAKQDVIADTSNGSVKVKLADVDSAGPLKIDSSNGSVHLELNSAFAGKLSCRTSNAKIRLDGIGGEIIEDGKKSKTIQFGESIAESRVKTSNGSITVKQPR